MTYPQMPAVRRGDAVRFGGDCFGHVIGRMAHRSATWAIQDDETGDIYTYFEDELVLVDADFDPETGAAAWQVPS